MASRSGAGKANFERAMVVHAVCRLPKAEWHNDRDQFMRPVQVPLPEEFVQDCVVWSLYANSNNTVAMRGVAYAGRVWLAHHALSSEALDVLAAAVPVWRTYFDRLNMLRLPKFRIATWDAGWWQARTALTEADLAASEWAAVSVRHERLEEKLLRKSRRSDSWLEAEKRGSRVRPRTSSPPT